MKLQYTIIIKKQRSNKRNGMVTDIQNYFPFSTYPYLPQLYPASTHPFLPAIHPYICQQQQQLHLDNPQNQQQPQQACEPHPIQTLQTQNKTPQVEKSQTKKEIKIRLKNRNVLPNKVSLILSYIRRVNKSGGRVERIVGKLKGTNQGFSQRQFYAYQHYLKENCVDHLGRDAVRALLTHTDPACSFFTLDEQKFYNKVGRILVRHYLAQTLTLDVLSMRKLKKSTPIEHLMIHRYLLNELQDDQGRPMTIEYADNE